MGSTNSSEQESAWRKRLWSEEIKQWIMSTLQNGTSTLSWTALQFIFNRSWWHRTWVSQEVFLAKEIYVAIGTHNLVPWREWDSMLWNIVRNWTWLAPLFQTLNLDIPLGIALGAARIISIRAWSNDPERLGLLRAVSMTRSTLCTDPRDKIYGVLGLAVDVEILGLRPDYDLSLTEVHRSLFMSMASVKGNLDYFGIAGSYGEDSSSPTWCANLDGKLEVWSLNSSIRNSKEEFFRAGGTSKPCIDVSSRNDVLKLRGFQVDIIGELWSQYFGSPIVQTASSPRSMYKDDNELFTALWKTCIGGLNPTSMLGEDRGPEEPRDENGLYFLERCYEVEKRLTESSEPPTMPAGEYLAATNFDQWYINNRSFQFGNLTLSDLIHTQHQKISASQTFQPSPLSRCEESASAVNVDQKTDFFRSWAGTNAFRRMFVTQNGYIGLGPHQILPGDIVCIFLGGRMPVVLRPKDSWWEFVGECYLVGGMFGEMMGCGRELQWFDLR